MLFLGAVFVVAVLSGATASVAGFGIGSLLTPLIAMRLGMTTAIAAVAVPHALATALRCWRLRQHIDGETLRSFGMLSAAGALAGALLYTRFSNRSLALILAALLIATGVAVLTDWSRRWHPRGVAAGAFGLTSGLFGGIAGNQGGLRAAALLAFPLTPLAFVATSTATGLMVDAARMPIYLWRAGSTLSPHLDVIAVASIGVLAGTLLGERMLLGLSVRHFRQAVAGCVTLLGIWMLARL
ncbi:MAG TPA: sulfite exporter TauE/SafE family protein [Gemmatimonadaceae bacterium]|nr:sulfite exporter TauE/SafE family protein [Gemmatimonadaceae bacterium]